MKKILVPIDFSSCSMDAFLYAKNLANTLGYSLKVIHVYSGNLSALEVDILQPNKSTIESLEEYLDFFVSPTPDTDASIATLSKIETEVISDINISSTLLNLAEDPEIAMIVMGTSGSKNIIDKMLGSISSTLAQKANCPVILIREGLKYKDFKNVLYASNYESANEELIQEVIDFGNTFRATMHFVHVDENDNYETVEDTIFYKLFEKGDPAFSFNMVNIKNKPVLEGLTQYAEENQVDLIVLVNRHRSHLDNLFQLSLTKKMALNTKFPLMVFHLMKE